MGRLSQEDILKLAQLSRLELTPEEIDEFADSISAILGYVEQLQQVDIDGLAPTHQVSGLLNVMRPDSVRDYAYQPAKLLDNVPHTKDGYIQVPRMVG